MKGLVPVAFALCWVVLASCGRCTGCAPPPPPAAREDLVLVQDALNPDKNYNYAMRSLELRPEAALRALRETRVEPGTHREFVVRLMTEHLQRVDTFRAWTKRVRKSARGMSAVGPRYPKRFEGLETRDHALFWSERLLSDGFDLDQVAAVGALERIGGPDARRALMEFVRSAGSPLGLNRAAQALGQMGEARALVEGIAVREPSIDVDRDLLLGGLLAMPPDLRRRTTAELLSDLEKSDLEKDDAPEYRRLGWVFVVGWIGDSEALGPLARVRETAWGRAHRAEVDAAIAGVLKRQAQEGATP